MKDITFSFYFESSEKTTYQILGYILERRFGFVPDQLIFDDDYKFEDGIIRLKNLDSDEIDSLSVIINGAELFLTSRLYFINEKRGSKVLSKLIIKTDLDSEIEFSTHDFLLSLDGFICAFYYDSDDEKWQSEQEMIKYVLDGRRYTHLPLTKNRVGEQVIDISNNYGRSIYSIGIRFLAASRMYFCGKLFKIIPFDNFKSYSNQWPGKFGNNEILKIELYSVFNDDLNIIRARQKAFLEQTKMFEIVESLNENYFGTKNALNSLGFD